MPLFPFASMPARVRKDPLGPLTVNQLARNIEAVQSLASAEHDTNGLHNALEVPRVLGWSKWDGGGGTYTDYLYSTATGYWSSNTNPAATGEMDIAVEPSGHTYPYMVPMVCCCDEDVLNKPWMATVEVIDGENLTVYLSKLSSALGAGNTWAATDGSFSFALHSLPVPTLPSLSTIASKQRRGFLTEGVTDWNAIVAAQGNARALALAEHDSSGNHNATAIAREYAHVTYDSGGVKYDLTAGDVASVSRISEGICEVTTTRTFTTDGMVAFAEVLPASNVDLWVANYRVTSTTTLRVYLYQYDSAADTWDRADGDFFLALYGD